MLCQNNNNNNSKNKNYIANYANLIVNYLISVGDKLILIKKLPTLYQTKQTRVYMVENLKQ